jgi:hypothetical protein
MSSRLLIAIIIYFVTPIVGIYYYYRLYKKMVGEKIKNAPAIEFFILFATYGGVLITILTAVFWEWSGMASIGGFYLIIVAPIVMGIIAYSYRIRMHDSKYHKAVHDLSLGYLIVIPILFIVAYLTK